MAEETEITENAGLPTQPVSVYDFITAMVDSMASLAWQKLGLQPDVYTGKIEKNIEEAKVAIDLTTHLAGFIEPRLDDDDKRRIHGLIRDLRINYVEKSKES
jgi:hypothetical protein